MQAHSLCEARDNNRETGCYKLYVNNGMLIPSLGLQLTSSGLGLKRGLEVQKVVGRTKKWIAERMEMRDDTPV